MHSTEPVTRAGLDEALLAGTEEDARLEQKGTTVKEVLLSGSWGLTWDRVEELNGRCFFGKAMMQIMKLTCMWHW